MNRFNLFMIHEAVHVTDVLHSIIFARLMLCYLFPISDHDVNDKRKLSPIQSIVSLSTSWRRENKSLMPTRTKWVLVKNIKKIYLL